MIGKVLKLLLVLALIFIIGWVLYKASTIILYVVIASIVALIGRPITRALKRARIKGRALPNAFSAAIALVVIFGVLGTVIGTFMPIIISEISHLSNIDFGRVGEKLTPFIKEFNDFIVRFNINSGTAINAHEMMSYFFNSFDLLALSNFFNLLVGVFGNFLIALFSIAFISFFFLKDENTIAKLILVLSPRRLENPVNEICSNTNITLSRYFLGLLIQMIAITICIYIGLSIIGIKNALLIATFTAVANLIPYIGPWIGATFGAFIVIANNIEFGFGEFVGPKLAGLVGVYVITQLLDNYIFQPTIFSNSIKAHPLEIFLVILIAGAVGGVLGMVAAIPVYSFLRIAFTEMNREFRWIEKIKAK